MFIARRMSDSERTILRCSSRSNSLRNILKADISEDEKSDTKGKPTPTKENNTVNIVLFAILLSLTILTMPHPLQTPNPTTWHVWYYGWISAVSTGLGAVPFFWWSQPSGRWLGLSNAIAGGMMLSASYSLASEATDLAGDRLALLGYQVSQMLRTAAGAAAGMGFVFLCQKYLEHDESLTVGAVKGLEVTRRSPPPRRPQLTTAARRRPRCCSWWA